jgi:hypothetical protein
MLWKFNTALFDSFLAQLGYYSVMAADKMLRN